MKISTVMGLALMVFAMALAIVIGQRMASETLAVIAMFVGVMAGVVASIPTSLIVVWVTMRQWEARQRQIERMAAAKAAQMQTPHTTAQAPEVRYVVVPPGTLPPDMPPDMPPNMPYPHNAYGPLSPGYRPLYHQPPTPAVSEQRTFTVIGGNEESDEL